MPRILPEEGWTENLPGGMWVRLGPWNHSHYKDVAEKINTPEKIRESKQVFHQNFKTDTDQDQAADCFQFFLEYVTKDFSDINAQEW